MILAWFLVLVGERRPEQKNLSFAGTTSYFVYYNHDTSYNSSISVIYTYWLCKCACIFGHVVMLKCEMLIEFSFSGCWLPKMQSIENHFRKLEVQICYMRLACTHLIKWRAFYAIGILWVSFLLLQLSCLPILSLSRPISSLFHRFFSLLYLF